jgi:dipeptidyl aminopeptidase/acylaminoacyl peptidase
MQPKEFQARDGLTIPAYLTLPPGMAPRGLPLVLLVHGGPWARDSYGFDPWVQLLANRGYAVLKVNFRGSTGFGASFLNAGNLQWGVGSMQHDLSDAVGWAIAEGVADPQRVAIVGGSYGGYATLCGLAFTPQLYRCGVDIVGPSNVATLFESMPPYWQVRKLRWKLRVGDVESDTELNRRISPLFHANAIRAPLLIGHGANDPRVKLSESEAIAAAVRANGRQVAFVVYPDEGHGFVRPENNLDFFGRVEEFLAVHLGGRAEPWRAVEGSSVQVQ